MPQGKYLPEGAKIATAENKTYTASRDGLQRARAEGAIIEVIASMCDTEHNILTDINGVQGIIPHDDVALGISEGTTREIAIISRVGKPICCKVEGFKNGMCILSRKAAQEEALCYFIENLEVGEVIKARITHVENFGVFADIGCGNVALLGIENISVSRISHPGERFRNKQEIYAIVLAKDYQNRRITLTHRELLGTWLENVQGLEAGETVSGVVRGIEDYGVFIELAPNLSGLAEKTADVKCGNAVAVYIKSIIPERMKIKLAIIDVLENLSPRLIEKSSYYVTEGKLEHWRYTPESSLGKIVETDFKAL